MEVLNNKIHFVKRLPFVENGKFFDNNPTFSDFYEKKYFQLNPTLHSDDVKEKLQIAISAINYLVEYNQFKPARIIDVGSGSIIILRKVIDYLKEFLRNYPIGLAIDISSSILQKTGSFDDIYKLRADASDLPIADNDFDLLMMFDVIEHTINPRQVVTEGLRVSKYVLIKTPLEQSLFTYFKGGTKRLKQLELKYGHIQHFRRGDVISLLGNNIRIVKEFYEIIPNRLSFVDKFQKLLLHLRLFGLFRLIFGGFIVLLITKK